MSSALWSVLYASEFEKKKWRPRVRIMTEAVSSTSVEEKPAGYWKKLLLKEMAGYKDTMWKTELRHMNPHTGMPALTEQVLRYSSLFFEQGRKKSLGYTNAHFITCVTFILYYLELKQTPKVTEHFSSHTSK